MTPSAPRGFIYGLHNGDQVIRYVGLTKRTLAERMSNHRSDALRGRNNPLHNWIRKNGFENVQQVVLEQVSDQVQLQLAEIKWIAEYRRRGNHLLNLTDGGEGGNGYCWPQELRERVSASRKAMWIGVDHPNLGRKHSPEAKMKMSLTRTGVKHGPISEQGRQNISASLLGRTLTPEHRANIGAGNAGKKRGPRSDETRAKISAGRVGRFHGSSNNQSKLVESDIPVIRQLATDGVTIASIARSYGVSWQAIKYVIIERSWTHVA